MEFFDSLINSHAQDRYGLPYFLMSLTDQLLLPVHRHSIVLLYRLTHLTVHHSSERSCWVALPPGLISKLYAESPTLPLVLELKTTNKGGCCTTASLQQKGSKA